MGSRKAAYGFDTNSLSLNYAVSPRGCGPNSCPRISLVHRRSRTVVVVEVRLRHRVLGVNDRLERVRRGRGHGPGFRRMGAPRDLREKSVRVRLGLKTDSRRWKGRMKRPVERAHGLYPAPESFAQIYYRPSVSTLLPVQFDIYLANSILTAQVVFLYNSNLAAILSPGRLRKRSKAQQLWLVAEEMGVFREHWHRDSNLLHSYAHQGRRNRRARAL